MPNDRKSMTSRQLISRIDHEGCFAELFDRLAPMMIRRLMATPGGTAKLADVMLATETHGRQAVAASYPQTPRKPRLRIFNPTR